MYIEAPHLPNEPRTRSSFRRFPIFSPTNAICTENFPQMLELGRRSHAFQLTYRLAQIPSERACWRQPTTNWALLNDNTLLYTINISSKCRRSSAFRNHLVCRRSMMVPAGFKAAS